MTAEGNLYMGEECRDYFEKELNEWFGKENWDLDGSPFSDFWDMANFPLTIEIDVLDYNDRKTIIGKVEIESDFHIEEGMWDRYIQTEPKSIKLLWIKDELKQLIIDKLEIINKK